MKYLFFDIECATCKGGGKICEFGYVLVDSNFKKIKSQLFVVNPKSSFDHYVIKEMLALPKESYNSSKDYTYYYPKIKKIITAKDVTVIGHTIESDAKYLADESKRYNLPFIDFPFYDVREIYCEINNLKESVNLEKMGVFLGCDSVEHLHQADQDAILTMRCAKAMCEKQGLSIEELLNKFDTSKGFVKDGAITCIYHQKAKLEKEKRLKELIAKNVMENESRRRFLSFTYGVERLTEIDSEFTGKKIAFNSNYEKTHYKEMLSIVQILKNHGAEYAHKVGRADYFINFYKKGFSVCPKYDAVKKINFRRTRIKVIDIGELLKRLNVTSAELKAMPDPDEKYYISKKEYLEKIAPQTIEYKEKSNTSVLQVAKFVQKKSKKA